MSFMKDKGLADLSLKKEVNSPLQKKMFFDILRIRRIEEEISRQYSDQEMRCPVHLSIGQEAIGVGVSANLKPGDYVMSGHRSHAHYLACGGNLDKFIAELYGKETGCTNGLGGSMHLIDKSAGFLGSVPIIGSTISIATGLAFETKRRKKSNVTVVYFGDSATEEGVFYESLNFAKSLNLPILYVCENNEMSVETPFSKRRHQQQKIVDIANSFNIESLCSDGQICEGVYGNAKYLIEGIRCGEGPKFIELMTTKLVEHCGPKIIGMESEGVCDPLTYYKEKLLNDKIIIQKDIDVYEMDIQEEIKKAFDKAKKAKFPSRDKLKANIFYKGEK